jgi:hypothetical protein
MPTDHIRYDILAQEALRGLVRKVLADTAKKGLIGDHHFFITFDTGADGVRLSERLREKYPQEMTIVLQHQFWDLKVTDEAFEVGLSFSGIAERLCVPFAAIKGFADPSVQFALQFETVAGEGAEHPAPAELAAEEAAGKGDGGRKETKEKAPARKPRARPSVPSTALPTPERAPAAAGSDKPPDKPGGEVVRLDRFRKK